MTRSLFRPGDRPLLHLGLLALTAVTTTGAFYEFWSGGGGSTANRLTASVTFSCCLLLILGSHEMGHYVLARIHGVNTSLPYFIPFPLGFGTLGAVIRIRAPIPNRNALVDIGVAGPLAGLAVAIPMLIYGVLHSPPTDTLPQLNWPSEMSLWKVAGQLWEYVSLRMHGQTPMESTAAAHLSQMTIFGDNLLTLGLKRLLLGPLPPGKDIHEHPVYLAAWGGLLVTMLNLIPIGQLDGGHVTYALFGARARTVGKVMAVFMLAMCVVASAGWVFWLAVTAGVVGFRHPEVAEPGIALTRGRRWTSILCGVGLVLCVMPIPLTVING